MSKSVKIQRTTRPRRAHGLVIASAAAVAAAALAGLLLTSDRFHRSRTSTGDAPPDSVSLETAHGAKRFAYGFLPGVAYRYDVAHATSVTRHGAPYAEASGTGTLELHVLDATPEYFDAVAKVDYEGAMQLSAGPSEPRPPRKLTATAYLRLGRDGQVQVLKFEHDKAAADHTAFVSVLSSALYVLPEIEISADATAKAHLARATDATGDYTATFEVIKHSAEAADLAMRKVKYTRSSALTRINASSHELRWNAAKGYLLTAKSTERFGKGAPEISVEATESAETKLAGLSASTFTMADLDRYTLQAAMYVGPEASAQQGRTLDARPVRSWAELEAGLDSLSPDPESEAPLELFNALSHSLAKVPEMLPSVLAAARKHEPGSTQFRMLVGAVSDLGTPDAQQGLVQLFRETDGVGKDLVLKAEALMEAPSTPQTRQHLLDTYDDPELEDVRNVAGLALGSSLKQLARGDESADAARQRVRAMWEQATSRPEKEYALAVIGNSGDASFLDLLAPEIQSPDSPYRVHALDALRFMNTQESGALLLHVLGLSEEPTMQAVALRALAHHAFRPEFAQPLASCFLDATDSNLRIACARVLMTQPALQQEMHVLLEQARASGNLDADMTAFIEGELG